jgi:hypothetical protein
MFGFNALLRDFIDLSMVLSFETILTSKRAASR